MKKYEEYPECCKICNNFYYNSKGYKINYKCKLNLPFPFKTSFCKYFKEGFPNV